MNSDILNAILRKDLGSFIAKTFSTVDTGTEFLPNWHIDLIAERLEAATNGEIKRLIINVPPRSLKSVSVSVAWPAWILGMNPSAKIMAASYSQILSLKHSLDCRLVMQSGWYKDLFPETIITPDQNEKFKFVTTARGFRFATSIGGTATGEGGDFLIVDDPHNPGQAASDLKRQHAIDWFDQTFMSRLNNKKKGVVVLVMQRLHVDDLTGHILEKGGWEHISIPSVQDVGLRRQSLTGYKIPENSIITEIMHPMREGEEEIRRAQLELGSYAFAAQYQQSPILQTGGMVELEWFRRYEEAPEGKIAQSWDTAIKANANNDYSVCTSWCETEKGYYLLDVMARKMEYPELKRTVVAMADKWHPDAILIEDKASGQSLLQDLRRETKLPVLAVTPTQDKTSRFAAVTALIEAGRVYIPRRAGWIADFEAQLLSFPNGTHDDIVDSVSQYLSWARKKGNFAPRVRII